MSLPYRWSGRRLWSGIQDTWIGIRNVIRWTPVIWNDADFDWHYLAVVMEYKLSCMARAFEGGHLMDSERHARECRVAAELLRRLMADEYDDAYQCVPEPLLPAFFRANEKRRQNDQRYLALLIGKYLRMWWD